MAFRWKERYFLSKEIEAISRGVTGLLPFASEKEQVEQVVLVLSVPQGFGS